MLHYSFPHSFSPFSSLPTPAAADWDPAPDLQVSAKCWTQSGWYQGAKLNLSWSFSFSNPEVQTVSTSKSKYRERSVQGREYFRSWRGPGVNVSQEWQLAAPSLYHRSLAPSSQVLTVMRLVSQRSRKWPSIRGSLAWRVNSFVSFHPTSGYLLELWWTQHPKKRIND